MTEVSSPALAVASCLTPQTPPDVDDSSQKERKKHLCVDGASCWQEDSAVHIYVDGALACRGCRRCGALHAARPPGVASPRYLNAARKRARSARC